MKLQPSKCRVLVPVSSDQRPYYSHIEQQAIMRQLQVIYGSMPILGGCVGVDDTIKTEHVKSTAQSHSHLLQSIQHQLMPSQSAYLILKMCINTRMNYLTRVTRPDLGLDCFHTF